MTSDNALLCPECGRGQHSCCSGDFSPDTVVTCACAYCKAWVDEHGPFAIPPHEGDA